MDDHMSLEPVFRFEANTTGTFNHRKIRFIRRANTGYLVEYLPSPEAEEIPDVMRGSRPDVEFTGRKIIPHAQLTGALLDGTLDIDEDEFVFIDHSQTFKPEFVASLDTRPSQDLVLRYATVMLMRELCAAKGTTRITRREVTGLEAAITEKLQARIDLLNDEVDRRRRHPMRRQNSPVQCATAQRILEWDQRLRERGFTGLVDLRHVSGNRTCKIHPVVAALIGDVLKNHVTLEKVSLKRLHGLVDSAVRAARADAEQKLLMREQDGEVISEVERDDLQKIVPPCIQTIKNWKLRIAPLELILNTKGPDWLMRNQLITGMGLQVERAGQVLIIDEYDADLMVAAPSNGRVCGEPSGPVRARLARAGLHNALPQTEAP